MLEGTLRNYYPNSVLLAAENIFIYFTQCPRFRDVYSVYFMDCVKQRKQGGPGACQLADLNSSQSCFNHKLSHNNNLCLIQFS